MKPTLTSSKEAAKCDATLDFFIKLFSFCFFIKLSRISYVHENWDNENDVQNFSGKFRKLFKSQTFSMKNHMIFIEILAFPFEKLFFFRLRFY